MKEGILGNLLEERVKGCRDVLQKTFKVKQNTHVFHDKVNSGVCLNFSNPHSEEIFFLESVSHRIVEVTSLSGCPL